jgi:hypothetical protein
MKCLLGSKLASALHLGCFRCHTRNTSFSLECSAALGKTEGLSSKDDDPSTAAIGAVTRSKTAITAYQTAAIVRFLLMGQEA